MSEPGNKERVPSSGVFNMQESNPHSTMVYENIGTVEARNPRPATATNPRIVNPVPIPIYQLADLSRSLCLALSEHTSPELGTHSLFPGLLSTHFISMDRYRSSAHLANFQVRSSLN